MRSLRVADSRRFPELPDQRIESNSNPLKFGKENFSSKVEEQIEFTHTINSREILMQQALPLRILNVTI
jgi:hypothetical protein